MICPAAKSSPSSEVMAEHPELIAAADASNPMGHIGDTYEDISPVALFLASDDCRYLTGNTLFVDGGSHINGSVVGARPARRAVGPRPPCAIGRRYREPCGDRSSLRSRCSSCPRRGARARGPVRPRSTIEARTGSATSVLVSSSATLDCDGGADGHRLPPQRGAGAGVRRWRVTAPSAKVAAAPAAARASAPRSTAGRRPARITGTSDGRRVTVTVNRERRLRHRRLGDRSAPCSATPSDAGPDPAPARGDGLDDAPRHRRSSTRCSAATP